MSGNRFALFRPLPSPQLPITNPIPSSSISSGEMSNTPSPFQNSWSNNIEAPTSSTHPPTEMTIPRGFEWVLEEEPEPEAKKRRIRYSAGPPPPPPPRQASSTSSNQRSRKKNTPYSPLFPSLPHGGGGETSRDSSSSSCSSSSNAISSSASASSSSVDNQNATSARRHTGTMNNSSHNTSFTIISSQDNDTQSQSMVTSSPNMMHFNNLQDDGQCKTQSAASTTATATVSDDQIIEQDTCPICLEDVGRAPTDEQLPCRHKLHQKCLQGLLRNGMKRCPLCKRNVETGSPQGKETKRSPGNFADDIVCSVCGYGDGDDQMLLCDGCDTPVHTYCLNPPLQSVPEGDWYCTSCSWMGDQRRRSGHYEQWSQSRRSRHERHLSFVAAATASRQNRSESGSDYFTRARDSPVPERRYLFRPRSPVHYSVLDETRDSLFDSE